MRLRELELAARKKLVAAGVDSPGLCARLLVAQAAGLDKIGCILGADLELPEERTRYLQDLLERRARGEPLAYLQGKKEFYGRDFEVSPATLVPRPETELLIELALDLLPEKGIRFCDAGCGSGCIGETLLMERPEWQCLLLDNSSEALRIARSNARSLGCKPLFICADIFVPPIAAACLDLVISNPPYIDPRKWRDVMPSTLAYEPHSALFSGEDGMAHLNAVIHNAAMQLKEGGFLILEHADTQGEAVQKSLGLSGFRQIRDYKDLAGLPRCAIARKCRRKEDG